MYFDNYTKKVYEYLNMTCITGEGTSELGRNEAFEVIIDKIRKIKGGNKTLFFAGNGASCSMAEHMSHDFFQNAGINTLTCSETSHITAVSNDLSFEMVYANKIERVLSEGDGLITISSSGNSPNILKAIETAKKNGVFVLTLSGMDENNKSRGMGDINIYVPATTYGLVESAHAVVLHAVLDCFLEK